MDLEKLRELCRLVRSDIITSTTRAGSGHASSALSAVELLTTLFFGGFLVYDLEKPENIANDRVIFSKGHASPLLYALYHVAGVLSQEELMNLRQFDSALEGHPTPRFKYVDVATGSLGQGLSIGLGMALGLKRKQVSNGEREPIVWTLLGDSEISEGQIWEAVQLASYYKLNNLVGILDVNRLGQQTETMLGWDVETYEKRFASFGWRTIVLNNGNNLQEVIEAFEKVFSDRKNSAPTMMIAKTVKGKGVSFMENEDGWHSKPVPEDKLDEVLQTLGTFDSNLRGSIKKSEKTILKTHTSLPHRIGQIEVGYKKGDEVTNRVAYGESLKQLGTFYPDIVALDAEISNSTYSELFKKAFPDRFFEMFIAEQNMVSAALGMSRVGFTPFVSTYAAFLTRAFDQIRMAQYSKANVKIVGSHGGVTVGPDGPSQMGLEDIAMMKSISKSVIFYPSDAVSTFKLVELMYEHQGISYLRTTRTKLPVIYDDKQMFKIGGSKILRQSPVDKAVIFAAGVTVHEALKAYELLRVKGENVAVVDLYSIKPLDEKTINELVSKVPRIIVVEDHYAYGAIGESVKMCLKSTNVNFTHLAVKKIPRSGTPEELLAYEEIDAATIVKTVINY